MVFRLIFHKLFTLNQCGPRLPRHFFEIGIQQETRHNLRISEDSGHNRRHPNYQLNFMNYEFSTSKQEQNVPHDKRGTGCQPGIVCRPGRKFLLRVKSDSNLLWGCIILFCQKQMIYSETVFLNSYLCRNRIMKS